MSDVSPREPRREDFQPSNGRNPFGDAVPATRPVGALANAEQQKSIAEVQARMIIARSNPRDAMRCMELILQDCTRPTLAKEALYQYSRGGSSISGPSIRLAEAIAQRWGNIASGIKEISRSGGYSECVAYAWDLESGYYDERQFQVRHWRDTKGGGYQLTDERDIYELIANMGQRRKRAVMMTVIPGDVVEAAVEQCEQTLHASADTSPDALAKMANAFAQFNVTKTQIEKWAQCRIEAIRPAQVVRLSKIFASLKDGMSDAADWFGTEGGAWAGVEANHAANQPAATEQRQATRKAPAKRAGTPPAGPIQDEIPTDRWDAERESATEQSRGAVATSAGDRPASGEATADAAQWTNAPVANPTPPATNTPPATAAFEAWLLDHEGDAMTDETGAPPNEPFRDPMAWALAYRAAVDTMFPADVELFRRANQEAMVQAQIASPLVAAILAGPKTETEPHQAQSEPASDPWLVPAPKSKGKADMQAYLETLKVTLAKAATPDEIGAVIDANSETYNGFLDARRLAAKALVEERLKQMSPAPARGEVKTLEDVARDLEHDIYSLVAVESVPAWLAMPTVKEALDKLIRENVPLHDAVMKKVAAKKTELTKARYVKMAAADPRTAGEILITLVKGFDQCTTQEEVNNLAKGVAYNDDLQVMYVKDPELYKEWTAAGKARVEELKRGA